MFYTLILLIVFTLFLLLNKPNNKDYIWIIIAILSFCLAIFAFIFYIFYLYEYYKITTAYFDFSSSLWLFLNSLRLQPFTINRLLNLGIVMFVFAFLNFCYLYTHSFNNSRKFIGYKYFIMPAVFLIIYDPGALRFFFSLALIIKRTYFNFSFTELLNVFNWINKACLLFYMLLGFYWLYKDYRQHTIKRIKKKILYVILCLMPISGLYAMMFYWFPQQIILLRETGTYRLHSSDFSFMEFSYGEFIHLPIFYKFYPVIAVVSIVIFIYAIYSLKAFSIIEKTQNDKFNYSLNTAGLGAKVFSHAIKDDLLAIKLLAQDCENKDGYSEEHKRIVRICDSNLKRLDNLKKVLNINIVKLSPISVVQCILQGIEKVNTPDYIELAVNFDEKPMEVYMDVDYFSEVIASLVQNSIDAINPKKGNGLIQIYAYTQNREITISIKDNGCGVSSEKISRIFDPFYSTKPSAKNWGMGLSYCSRIIQLHNGEIHFNSTLNTGSEVLIYLPSLNM